VVRDCSEEYGRRQRTDEARRDLEES